MATDYTTSCGGVPLSFIQMLASTIFGYHDIAGVMHYRINALGATNSCTELSDFLNCNISHIEPERQLVENTFALDDCGLLAWKIFSNTDTKWVDYSNCTELPQTFIQMLARCIVSYNSHNKINAYFNNGNCQSIVALLNCNTNSIESERLLVSNVFGTDPCGRMIIKFYTNSSAMTDYHTPCEATPQSLYQMLARCIVLYNGNYYINTAVVVGVCEDLHAFWTCANNHIDPERALVENIFATDACGNLAVKIFGNSQFTWRGGDQ